MNANKMVATDLAEYLTEYSVIKEGPFSQVIGAKAAAMLRKQAEAIKVLRGALGQITDSVSANTAAINYPLVDDALRALKETEEFK